MGNDNGGGFCSGFFMGAAFGAMAAVLLTPRSGRDLRRQILGESERFRDRAREMRERGEEAVEKTRETARDAKKGLKEAAEILRTGSAEDPS